MNKTPFLLLLAIGMLPSMAMASEVTAGNVGEVAVASTPPTSTGGARAFVKTDGVRTGQPACARLPRFVINLNTPEGPAQLSLVLSAKLSGLKVAISGTGLCPDNDSESISNIKITP